MDQHFELIPEDRAIQGLVGVLGFKKTNLGDGISQTLNKINKHFNNRFAVGIVDDDKQKPGGYDAYSNLLDEKDGLKLIQKPQSRHFLIVITPAVESWLFQCADQCEIDPSKYGFSTLKQLTRITKDPLNVGKDNQLRRFLHDLYQAKTPGFVSLEEWITGLIEKYI